MARWSTTVEVTLDSGSEKAGSNLEERDLNISIFTMKMYKQDPLNMHCVCLIISAMIPGEEACNGNKCQMSERPGYKGHFKVNSHISAIRHTMLRETQK